MADSITWQSNVRNGYGSGSADSPLTADKDCGAGNSSSAHLTVNSFNCIENSEGINFNNNSFTDSQQYIRIDGLNGNNIRDISSTNSCVEINL